MKKLLVLIAFLLANQTSSQQVTCVEPYTPYVENYILNQVCQDYLPPSVQVFYVSASPLHTVIGGVTHQLDSNTYLVQVGLFLPTQEARLRTLLHEIGHVIDMQSGRLDYATQEWNGRAYPNLQWADRPWEQSAEEWSKCLFYEYVIKPELKRRGLIKTAGPRIDF